MTTSYIHPLYETTFYTPRSKVGVVECMLDERVARSTGESFGQLFVMQGDVYEGLPSALQWPVRDEKR